MTTKTTPKLRTPAMLKRDNARFAKMTKPQKRVAIAKDALSAIAAKLYVATPGTYCAIPELDDTRNFYVWEERVNALTEKDLRKQLREADFTTCNCCAVGSLLASKARVADKVTVRQYLDGLNTFEELEAYFDREQLCLMEAAFEKDDVSGCEDRAACARAICFGRGYKTPRNRLIAILTNVVENGGEFVV